MDNSSGHLSRTVASGDRASHSASPVSATVQGARLGDAGVKYGSVGSKVVDREKGEILPIGVKRKTVQERTTSGSGGEVSSSSRTSLGSSQMAPPQRTIVKPSKRKMPPRMLPPRFRQRTHPSPDLTPTRQMGHDVDASDLHGQLTPTRQMGHDVDASDLHGQLTPTRQMGHDVDASDLHGQLTPTRQMGHDVDASDLHGQLTPTRQMGHDVDASDQHGQLTPRQMGHDVDASDLHGQLTSVRQMGRDVDASDLHGQHQPPVYSWPSLLSPVCDAFTMSASFKSLGYSQCGSLDDMATESLGYCKPNCKPSLDDMAVDCSESFTETVLEKEDSVPDGAERLGHQPGKTAQVIVWRERGISGSSHPWVSSVNSWKTLPDGTALRQAWQPVPPDMMLYCRKPTHLDVPAVPVLVCNSMGHFLPNRLVLFHPLMGNSTPTHANSEIRMPAESEIPMPADRLSDPHACRQ